MYVLLMVSVRDLCPSVAMKMCPENAQNKNKIRQGRFGLPHLSGLETGLSYMHRYQRIMHHSN